MKVLFKSKLVLSLLTMVLLASILAVSLLFFSGGRLHATEAASGPQVLHVFERNTSSKLIQVGTQQDIRGSLLVFDDLVFDATNKHQIGRASGSCTFISNTSVECGWTDILPQGRITIQGRDTESQTTATFAITGGTGSYTGAKGWLYEIKIRTPKGVLLGFEEFFHLV